MLNDCTMNFGPPILNEPRLAHALYSFSKMRYQFWSWQIVLYYDMNDYIMQGKKKTFLFREKFQQAEINGKLR